MSIKNKNTPMTFTNIGDSVPMIYICLCVIIHMPLFVIELCAHLHIKCTEVYVSMTRTNLILSVNSAHKSVYCTLSSSVFRPVHSILHCSLALFYYYFPFKLCNSSAFLEYLLCFVSLFFLHSHLLSMYKVVIQSTDYHVAFIFARIIQCCQLWHKIWDTHSIFIQPKRIELFSENEFLRY